MKSPPTHDLAVLPERKRLERTLRASEVVAVLGVLFFLGALAISHTAGAVLMVIGLLLIVGGARNGQRLSRQLEMFDADALANAQAQRSRVVESEATFVDGRPVLELTLEVLGSTHTSRPTVTCPRDDRREQLARPGAEIWLRVHPALPHRVEVDWELTAQHAPAAPDIPQSLATVTLTCSSCGAKLELQGRTSVVCQYCHTENHVVRS